MAVLLMYNALPSDESSSAIKCNTGAFLFRLHFLEANLTRYLSTRLDWWSPLRLNAPWQTISHCINKIILYLKRVNITKLLRIQN
jgi:hypothetical protein